MSEPIYKINIMGTQGAGKGIQAKLLSQKLEIPTYSMGQVLRDEKAKNTKLARSIGSYLDLGHLAPNDIVYELIMVRLAQPEAARGYVLDGFPRMIEQAKFFETKESLTHAIAINISDSEAVDRVSGRRACPCGDSYHMKYKPPKDNETCDQCGAKLTVRIDSQPKAIKARLKIYHEETEPLIEYYREMGILHEINGEQSIEQAHEAILKIFDL